MERGKIVYLLQPPGRNSGLLAYMLGATCPADHFSSAHLIRAVSAIKIVQGKSSPAWSHYRILLGLIKQNPVINMAAYHICGGASELRHNSDAWKIVPQLRGPCFWSS